MDTGSRQWASLKQTPAYGCHPERGGCFVWRGSRAVEDAYLLRPCGASAEHSSRRLLLRTLTVRITDPTIGAFRLTRLFAKDEAESLRTTLLI